MSEEPVKQRPDPVPCSSCGRPTWSPDRLCQVCRTHAAPEAPPGVVPPPIVEPQEGSSEPALDEAGHLAEAIPCRACGYRLLGLDPHGLCPECAAPIQRSIHGDLLRFCDPKWVERLARGVTFIIIGALATVVFYVFFIAAMISMSTSPTAPIGAVMAGFMVVSMGIAVITTMGVWWLTTSDPGRIEAEAPIGARTVARWCILAQFVAAPLAYAAGGGTAPGNPATSVTPFMAILMIAGSLFGLLVLVGQASGLVYLRSLALRLPRPGLARQTRIVTWGYIGSSLLMQGAGLASQLAFARTGATPGPQMLAVASTSCLAALGELVFGLWLLVLLLQYAGTFRSAAAEARSAWSTSSSRRASRAISPGARSSRP